MESKKTPLDSPGSGTSPWVWSLLLITVVQTSLFAMVTVYQYDNTRLLQTADQTLNDKIKTVQESLTKEGSETKPRIQKRADNFIADILIEQEKIIAQHCITKNKTCTKGEPGDPGQPGVKGDKGQPGMFGDPGYPGSDGAKGQQGIRGDKGEAGLKGETGPKGQRGVKGDTGSTGLKGEQGPRGPKGDSGTTGQKGALGIRGDKGESGEKGAVGEAGDPGNTGGQGQKGDKGDPGPQGPAGPDSSKDGCACLQYPVFEDPTAITTIYMASGETRNLPCNATGSPPPSVSLKKQQPILSRSGSRDRRNLMKLNGRFTISNAALEDFGVYECRASNGLGSITKQINVANGVPPNIAKQPRSSSNNAGTTVDFRCVSSGIPTPTVTWYKDGKPLVADSRHQISSDGETLSIINLRTSDSGIFSCQASNALGATTSRDAVLTII
ncbi:uncharacterized protein LOC111109475 [Crassostrea virginica]